MKIEILDSARQDLVDGYRFYEKQAEGVGSIFSTRCFPILTHWLSTPASILCISEITTGCYPSAFLSPFITSLRSR